MHSLIFYLLVLAAPPKAAWAVTHQKVGRIVASELTLVEAEKLVETFLNRNGNPQQIAIVPGKTSTYEFGYVVECQPRKVLEGGDPKKFGIPGVGAVIVDKVSRKIFDIGSIPKNTAIDTFIKNRTIGGVP